jgi:desulfoferrodoxin (superoxide reductase-like protein)
VVTIKTDKPGKLLALSFCNIHGLWQSSAAVKIG